MYPKRLILDDARHWGIAILPVDIHASGADYRVERVDPDIAPVMKNLFDAAVNVEAMGNKARVVFGDYFPAAQKTAEEPD